MVAWVESAGLGGHGQLLAVAVSQSQGSQVYVWSRQAVRLCTSAGWVAGWLGGCVCCGGWYGWLT